MHFWGLLFKRLVPFFKKVIKSYDITMFFLNLHTSMITMHCLRFHVEKRYLSIFYTIKKYFFPIYNTYSTHLLRKK